MNPDRTLPWDWHPGRVPNNVIVHPEAYLETTYSFERFRSRQPEGVRIGRGASIYLGVMFDLGLGASVSIGEFSLLNGSRILCDASITIGAYCLISWNTVLMDSRRVPRSPQARRAVLEAAARSSNRDMGGTEPASPIVVGNGVWLGFESCVFPGVEIGDGAIVGARSVVVESVPAYSIVAGNPARIVRQLDPHESQQAVEAVLANFNRTVALQ